MLIHSGFVVAILNERRNKYFRISVSNMINVDRYSPNKDQLFNFLSSFLRM